MEPGQVVEYIESQKILCAVVLEAKNLRLRLLSENNREVKLSAGRLLHRSTERLDPTMGRDKLTARLKEIAARRKALSLTVDIQGLWEVLQEEQSAVDLTTLTALSFPEHANSEQESAVMRALFDDRLYFKFGPDQFHPHPAAKVEEMIAQRARQEQEERLVEQGGAWMKSVLSGPAAAGRPELADDIVPILISYYLFEKESPRRDLGRAMLKRAGVGSIETIFDFLVRIGVWQPNENLDLLREGVTDAFPEAIQRRAASLADHPPTAEEGRRDLRELALMTIDGPSTQDFDDALSITPQGDHFVIGIHISDVGHYLGRHDPIDQEAMGRASSIYLPDRKISMLPESLSVGICSLKQDQDRPAISTLVTLTPNAEVVAYDIVPSLIRVSRQLTYQDADALTETDTQMRALHAIARNYRSRRLDDGALIIELPEIAIRIDANGKPMVTRIDRENPSHLFVSELMILANSLAARFLSEKGLPAIFRSQAEPRERLFKRDQGSLFQSWMQRKQINRFNLSSSPEPHAGLGVAAYVTCTSPIRKYFDLMTQRQLRAALGLEKPYQAEAIDAAIAALAEPMARVGRLQYRRHRYWLLKYLEGRIGTKEEAVILYKRRGAYFILLPQYLIECPLAGAENIKFKPEDLVQVTIQHVNARKDVITVYLG